MDLTHSSDPLILLSNLLLDEQSPTVAIPIGERREVVVFFLDIVGFTSLAEKLNNPEKQYTIISQVFAAFSKIIDDHGGKVEKYIGDAILAVWGTDQITEFDAEKAVRSGLEILQKLISVNQTLSPLGIEIQARIGINAGMAIFVPDPSQTPDPRNARSWSVTGDTVNTAQRLESNAKPGSILISASVREQAGEAFIYEDKGDLTVKGKQHPIHIYQIAGKGAGRKKPWERVELVKHSRMVGRDKELSRLNNHLTSEPELNDDGFAKPHIIGIRAEAGMGKSRLCSEFTASLTVTLLKGQTIAYAQPSNWVWMTLLRDFFQVNEIDPDGYRKLEEKISSIENEKRRNRLQSSLPFLAHQLDLKSPDSDGIRSMDAKIINQEVKLGIKWLLESLAENNRIVVLLEDYHWIDSASNSLLKYLIRTLESNYPILFLLPYRPSVTLPAIDPDEAILDDIILTEIGNEDCRDLLHSMLGSRLPEETEQFLLSRADGNPFYIEEVVISLVSRGILQQDGKQWLAMQPLSEADVPQTLQAIILSRIDNLELKQKELLKYASVIGRLFLVEVLEQMVARLSPEIDLESELRALSHVNLIFESIDSRERAYLFKHAITRDVAYGTFLDVQLRNLHRIVAEIMEQMFSDTETYAGMIAEHWEKSQAAPEKIDQWNMKALKHYAFNYRFEDGIALGEKLLKRLDDLPDTVDRCKKKYPIAMQLFGLYANFPEKKLALLEDSEHEARKYGLNDQLAIILTRFAHLYDNQKLLDKATQYYLEAEPLVRALKNKEELLSVLINLAYCAFVKTNLDSSNRYLEEALQYFDESSNIADCFNIEQIQILSRVEDAFSPLIDELYEKYIRIGKVKFNRSIVAISLGQWGRFCAIRRDFNGALDKFNSAIEIYQQIGLLDRIADCYYDIGHCYHYAGSYDLAISNSQKAMSMHRKLHDSQQIVWCILTIYKSLLRLNRLPEAEELYRLGIDEARKIHDLNDEVYFKVETGVFYLRQKELDRAVQYYDEIGAMFDILPDYEPMHYFVNRYRKRLIESGVDPVRLPIPEVYLTAQPATDMFDW